MDGQIALWFIIFVGGYLAIMGYFIKIALSAEKNNQN